MQSWGYDLALTLIELNQEQLQPALFSTELVGNFPVEYVCFLPENSGPSKHFIELGFAGKYLPWARGTFFPMERGRHWEVMRESYPNS